MNKKTQAAQVYFPVELYMRLKLRSSQDGLPLATWIRNVVQTELERSSKKKEKKFSDLPTFAMGGGINSEKLDKIIYSKPHGSA